MQEIHSDAALILGKRLREERQKVGLTLEDLGSLSGMHWTSVGKIERGQVHPNVETLVRLSTALNVDPSEFVAGLTADLYPKREQLVTAAEYLEAKKRMASEAKEREESGGA